MDYLEIEGKAQLARFGIPVNQCNVLLTEESIPPEVPIPCILKGQILSGKRGKAGAVKVVKTAEELLKVRKEILDITIGDNVMEGVMAAELVDIDQEFYLGMTLDVTTRSMLLLFTPFGGMDIEELAETAPEKLMRFDCTKGFDGNAFQSAVNSMFSLPPQQETQVVDIAEKLATACFQLDATTIEINPLALLKDGRLLAIDAKLVIDDNALYRQEDYTLIPRTEEKLSAEEEEAASFDLTYVELDPLGDIGTMAGGAGIGMATMDTIQHYGGRPNNFMDLGGGVTAEKTYHAMRLLLQNEATKYILINVFGGINNCADMAEGIYKAYTESNSDKVVVVKSRGFNQEQGWELYEKAGFSQTKYGTTDEAVKQLLALKEGKS